MLIEQLSTILFPFFSFAVPFFSTKFSHDELRSKTRYNRGDSLWQPTCNYRTRCKCGGKKNRADRFRNAPISSASRERHETVGSSLSRNFFFAMSRATIPCYFSVYICIKVAKSILITSILLIFDRTS